MPAPDPHEFDVILEGRSRQSLGQNVRAVCSPMGSPGVLEVQIFKNSCFTSANAHFLIFSLKQSVVLKGRRAPSSLCCQICEKFDTLGGGWIKPLKWEYYILYASECAFFNIFSQTEFLFEGQVRPK